MTDGYRQSFAPPRKQWVWDLEDLPPPSPLETASALLKQVHVPGAEVADGFADGDAEGVGAGGAAAAAAVGDVVVVGDAEDAVS